MQSVESASVTPASRSTAYWSNAKVRSDKRHRRQQDADNPGRRHRTGSFGRDVLEVVGAGAPELGSQVGRSGVRDLLRMQARSEPASRCGLQNPPRLVEGEDALVAEDVDPARASDGGLRNGRDDLVDVLVAVASIGDDVSAKVGGFDIPGQRGPESCDDVEAPAARAPV